MNITIVGAGAVGAALAEGWSRAGHRVTVAVRDTTAAKAVSLAQKFDVAIAAMSDAAKDAEVIVLAVPWDAAQNAVTALGDLSGKVLIDATNPLAFADGALHLVQPQGSSGGEQIAQWAQGARVVKTLNQVGAEMMSAEKSMPALPVMFIAGDHEPANETVKSLVGDLGFEALVAGALSQSRHLEHFAMVWINQAVFQGFGRQWAFAALRNQEKTV